MTFSTSAHGTRRTKGINTTYNYAKYFNKKNTPPRQLGPNQTRAKHPDPRNEIQHTILASVLPVHSMLQK